MLPPRSIQLRPHVRIELIYGVEWEPDGTTTILIGKDDRLTLLIRSERPAWGKIHGSCYHLSMHKHLHVLDGTVSSLLYSAHKDFYAEE